MPTPNTADAMKRYKAGKAGFTDKAHLKAKGLIPRADGTKRKSPKYEDLDKDKALKILDQIISGEKPKPGSYRLNSEPENNRKTLLDVKNAQW